MRDALLIFDSVFLTLGLASNIFVWFIMARRKLIRKSVCSYYIFHLSTAEVFYRTVLVVLKIVIAITDSRSISNAECKAMSFWRKTTSAAIYLLLSGIAMDRKNHIINPLKNLGLAKHRSMKIVFIWLFSMVISLTVIFSDQANRRLNSVGQDNSSQPMFICVLPRGAFASQICFTIYFFLAFVVPLSIITHSYCKIFIFLRRRATKQTFSACYIKTKYKALRMLVLIVVSLLLSWGPIMVSDLARAYGNTVKVEDISMRQIAISISLTSSVIHPVIYSFGNANFRREVVKAFRDCKTFRR